jgi:hypothetical protein
MGGDWREVEGTDWGLNLTRSESGNLVNDWGELEQSLPYSLSDALT